MTCAGRGGRRGRMVRPEAVKDLLAAAEQARQLRAYQTDADVVALEVERAGRTVTRVMYAGIGLGFAFTTTNVQQFVAAGAPATDPRWWAAWLMEPMLILVVVAILRAHQVITRHGVRTGFWLKASVLLAGSATYAMNTWQSWAAGDVTGIVLHSIPPLVIVVAVEAVTELRECLADAAARAAANAPTSPSVNRSANGLAYGSGPSAADSAGQFANAANTTANPVVRQVTNHSGNGAPAARSAANRSRTSDRTSAVGGSRGRATTDEFVEAARAAWTPGTVPDAAWVMQVAGCKKTAAYKVLRILQDRAPHLFGALEPDGASTSAPANKAEAPGELTNGSRVGDGERPRLAAVAGSYGEGD